MRQRIQFQEHRLERQWHFLTQSPRSWVVLRNCGTLPSRLAAVLSTAHSQGRELQHRPNLVIDSGLVNGLTGTSTRWQVASGITYVLPRRLSGFFTLGG